MNFSLASSSRYTLSFPPASNTSNTSSAFNISEKSYASYDSHSLLDAPLSPPGLQLMPASPTPVRRNTLNAQPLQLTERCLRKGLPISIRTDVVTGQINGPRSVKKAKKVIKAKTTRLTTMKTDHRNKSYLKNLTPIQRFELRGMKPMTDAEMDEFLNPSAVPESLAVSSTSSSESIIIHRERLEVPQLPFESPKRRRIEDEEDEEQSSDRRAKRRFILSPAALSESVQNNSAASFAPSVGNFDCSPASPLWLDEKARQLTIPVIKVEFVDDLDLSKPLLAEPILSRQDDTTEIVRSKRFLFAELPEELPRLMILSKEAAYLSTSVQQNQPVWMSTWLKSWRDVHLRRTAFYKRVELLIHKWISLEIVERDQLNKHVKKDHRFSCAAIFLRTLFFFFLFPVSL